MQIIDTAVNDLVEEAKNVAKTALSILTAVDEKQVSVHDALKSIDVLTSELNNVQGMDNLLVPIKEFVRQVRQSLEGKLS